MDSPTIQKLTLAKDFPHIEKLFTSQTTLLPASSQEVLALGHLDLEKRTEAFKIGVIGTRKPSRYGLRFVEELLQSCSAYKDWIWISGGALGIDGELHRQALQQNLKTQAWLVGPILDPSPTSHFKLFSQMKKREGCGLLVPSVLEPSGEMKIFPSHWLARNRWLAADVDVLVVVEAHEKSGTWNTTTSSLDFAKDTYILPGPIFSESSKGTNAMISMGYGHIIESLTEVTKSLVVAFERRSYNYR
jgi:DNA processing protein